MCRRDNVDLTSNPCQNRTKLRALEKQVGFGSMIFCHAIIDNIEFFPNRYRLMYVPNLIKLKFIGSNNMRVVIFFSLSFSNFEFWESLQNNIYKQNQIEIKMGSLITIVFKNLNLRVIRRRTFLISYRISVYIIDSRSRVILKKLRYFTAQWIWRTYSINE